MEKTNYINLRESMSFPPFLDEVFALDHHRKSAAYQGAQRTYVGQLVRTSKPYENNGVQNWNPKMQKRADELADLMIQFIQSHAAFREAEFLVAVPSSNPNKRYDLPSYLVSRVAIATGQTVPRSGSIRKLSQSKQMKFVRTMKEKRENIEDTMEAEPDAFAGKKILIIDDICESGVTISEVSKVLH